MKGEITQEGSNDIPTIIEYAILPNILASP